MNTGFPPRNTRALDNTDQPASSRPTPTTPPDIANRPQHQILTPSQPLYAQPQPSASQPHQHTTPHTASMYSASYHSRAPGQPHNSQPAHHHHMYQTHQPSQQDQQDQNDTQQPLQQQQQQQQHQQQHQHQYPPSKQQHQQHQQHQHQQQQNYQQTAHHTQYPLQRAAGQAFSVPRTVSTPSWMSGTHSAAYPASSNISPPASATAPLSSSSSSASLLSYWDQSVASDSELAMASAISPTDAHYTLSDSSHHRYASSASLPALSPTGVVSHPIALNAAATPAQMYYGVGSAEHFHPYRPASVQPMAPGSAMQSYHPAMVSVSPGGVVYQGSLSTQHASGGLVYGASSSSLPLASGSSYDAYSPSFGTHSGYVSYLAPQSAHDSRFYALNPFEIKHRRRTTKTQFRVLESTFREVPKPNATLRKQISAQLDMPVRAVQIWFQNRRAKAKALEKKRNRDGGTDAGNDRGRVGDVGASHTGMDAERRTQEVSYGVGLEQHDRGHASGYADAQRESRSVDLPPLRLHADTQRQTAYAPLSPRLTLPAIHVDASRDRRLASPPPASPAPSSAASHTLHGHTELPRHGMTADAVEASLRSNRLNAPALPSVSSRQPGHDAGRYWAAQQ
ncbi:transcription factor [Moesziomyces antarcticus T-34]|uniref:Transcription factor n=1 Tax=Pseudozyma antarctica (strain T-34) TaxID=1151754 RepID=M9LT21_PSEA3|nr:transcription factor [Moesziomyces antarcticus T-34]